jgi:hypothetical protein
MKYVAWYKKFWDASEATFQSYEKVREFDAKDLDDAYYMMQGEIWSPNGEARFLIKCLGLSHTSMSVGDFIEDTFHGCFYKVDSFGFKKYDSLPTDEAIR